MEERMKEIKEGNEKLRESEKKRIRKEREKKQEGNKREREQEGRKKKKEINM